MPPFHALCRYFVATAVLFLVAGILPSSIGLVGTVRAEPANDAAEKQAFEDAKDLGTIDAWQAFLKNYQSGFRSDLARAYLKKLGDAQALPAATASTGNAQSISCNEAHTLKSKESSTAARITFINKSGATRVIQWKAFDGGYKEYATLEPGQELVQETYLTHPWMAVNGPGDCANAFLPVPGNSTAILDVTNDQIADRQHGVRIDHGPTLEPSRSDSGMVYGDGPRVAKHRADKERLKK